MTDVIYLTLKEKKANLIKLRDYLKSLPEDYTMFDMSTYGKTDIVDGKVVHGSCNTPACVAGHGPSAGIFIDNSLIREYNEISDINHAKHYVDWTTYCYDNFVYNPDPFGDDLEWAFLFGDLWNNSLEGAINRIDEYLDNAGIPPYFDVEYYSSLEKEEHE